MKLVEGFTDEEIDKIEKQLMRAFNELCKAEKLLREKGSDNNGERTRESNTSK